MKTLLLGAALAFASFGASAGLVPLDDGVGNAENGGQHIRFTDFTSIATGVGDAQFALTSQFGAFNSPGSRSFGISLFNTVTDTVVASKEIFTSSALSTPVQFASLVYNQSAKTVAVGATTLNILQDLVVGFYFESDGDTTYSWNAANTGANAGDHFGFYDQPIGSPFDLMVYASDADFGSNLDYAWVGVEDVATVVPEPAMLALMGLGLAGVAGLRRRRKQQ